MLDFESQAVDEQLGLPFLCCLLRKQVNFSQANDTIAVSPTKGKHATMKIERLNVFDSPNDRAEMSYAQFKRIENGLKNAAFWIKNPSSEPAWKDEIFCYPKRITLEKARKGEGWSSRRYTVHPLFEKAEVFIENDRSSQWMVTFGDRVEMDAWLKQTIIAEKHSMIDA